MIAEQTDLQSGLRAIHEDVGRFSAAVYRQHRFRPYQERFAQAVVESVLKRDGRMFAAVFSRQAGKDEALAQVCAFLLSRYRLAGGSIVIALPALKPQGIIARDRLVTRLDSPLTRNDLQVREGTIVELGKASVRYLSAAKSANSRGNTASLLLVANEAQDIDPDVWDSVFAPMAAAGNATTLFMGTVWTSDTLLARQMRMLRDMERDDGERCVFKVGWREVAGEIPSYGRYVEKQIRQLGPNHPFIQTEYELEELDGDGRLFTPDRLANLRGRFQAIERPSADDPPGTQYAFTIDVAGEVEDGVEGEAVRRREPRRDSTALSVIRVLPSGANQMPEYQIVARYLWTGARHQQLHGRIIRLARDVWGVRKIVIDATGIGAGLASFLRASLGERVVEPFTFTSSSKSQLAWDLLGLLDSGRMGAFDPDLGCPAGQANLDHLFWRQLEACRYSVLPGPGKLLRWSVEDETLHDDLLTSTALIAALDRLDWRPRRAVGRA